MLAHPPRSTPLRKQQLRALMRVRAALRLHEHMIKDAARGGPWLAAQHARIHWERAWRAWAIKSLHNDMLAAVDVGAIIDAQMAGRPLAKAATPDPGDREKPGPKGAPPDRHPPDKQIPLTQEQIDAAALAQEDAASGGPPAGQAAGGQQHASIQQDVTNFFAGPGDELASTLIGHGEHEAPPEPNAAGGDEAAVIRERIRQQIARERAHGAALQQIKQALVTQLDIGSPEFWTQGPGANAIQAYVQMALGEGQDAGQYALDALGVNERFAWANPRQTGQDLMAVRGSKVVMHAADTHLEQLTNIIANATRPEQPLGVDAVKAQVQAEWTSLKGYQAERIARTETANVWEASSYNTMAANGVEQYGVLLADSASNAEAMNLTACEVCIAAAAAGAAFDIGDAGNVPPYHPNCRCTAVPKLDVVDPHTGEERPWLPPKEPWTGQEHPGLGPLPDPGRPMMAAEPYHPLPTDEHPGARYRTSPPPEPSVRPHEAKPSFTGHGARAHEGRGGERLSRPEPNVGARPEPGPPGSGERYHLVDGEGTVLYESNYAASLRRYRSQKLTADERVGTKIIDTGAREVHPGAEFAVGDRVSVLHEGTWQEGTVERVVPPVAAPGEEGGQYYYGVKMSDGSTEAARADQIIRPVAPPLPAGPVDPRAITAIPPKGTEIEVLTSFGLPEGQRGWMRVKVAGDTGDPALPILAEMPDGSIRMYAFTDARKIEGAAPERYHGWTAPRPVTTVPHEGDYVVKAGNEFWQSNVIRVSGDPERTVGVTVEARTAAEAEQKIALAEAWLNEYPVDLPIRNISFLAGKNPGDREAFTSAAHATSGSGGYITFFNGEHGEGTFLHETGHVMGTRWDNVGSGAALERWNKLVERPNIKKLPVEMRFVYNSANGPRDAYRWLDAIDGDISHQAARFDHFFGPSEPSAYNLHGYKIGGAVTEYGGTNLKEDWAESIEGYLYDRKYGKFGHAWLSDAAAKADGHTAEEILNGVRVDVRFADVYPERARILDAIYGPTPGAPWSAQVGDFVEVKTPRGWERVEVMHAYPNGALTLKWPDGVMGAANRNEVRRIEEAGAEVVKPIPLAKTDIEWPTVGPNTWQSSVPVSFGGNPIRVEIFDGRRTGDGFIHVRTAGDNLPGVGGVEIGKYDNVVDAREAAEIFIVKAHNEAMTADEARAATAAPEGNINRPLLNEQAAVDGPRLAEGTPEREAARAYKGASYRSINDLLRGKVLDEHAWTPEREAEVREHAQAFLASFGETTGPQTLMRGIDEKALAHLTGGGDPSSLVGAVIRDDGFMSTATLESTFVRGDVRFYIDTPQGTKAFGYYAQMGTTAEHEIVLAPGTELRIASVVTREQKQKELEDLIDSGANLNERLPSGLTVKEEFDARVYADGHGTSIRAEVVGQVTPASLTENVPAVVHNLTGTESLQELRDLRDAGRITDEQYNAAADALHPAPEPAAGVAVPESGGALLRFDSQPGDPARDKLIALYTGNGPQGRIAKALRDGTPLDPADAKVLAKWDKLIADSPQLGVETTVYRGMARRARLADLKPGDVFTDRALGSTTTDYDVAENFSQRFGAKAGDNAIVEIKLPPEQRGLRPLSGTKKDDSDVWAQEYVLPRDTEFRVVSVEDRPGQPSLIKLEALPREPLAEDNLYARWRADKEAADARVAEGERRMVEGAAAFARIQEIGMANLGDKLGEVMVAFNRDELKTAEDVDRFLAREAGPEPGIGAAPAGGDAAQLAARAKEKIRAFNANEPGAELPNKEEMAALRAENQAADLVGKDAATLRAELKQLHEGGDGPLGNIAMRGHRGGRNGMEWIERPQITMEQLKYREELPGLIREAERPALAEIPAPPEYADLGFEQIEGDGARGVWHHDAHGVERVGEWDDNARNDYVVHDDKTLANNAKLRAGGAPTAWARKVDKLTRADRITQEGTLYRGAQLDAGVVDGLVPGAMFTDKGFMSTSPDRALADTYNGIRAGHLAEAGQVKQQVLFHIRVGEGNTVGRMDMGANYAEWVLPRNTEMHVVGRTWDAEKKQWEVWVDARPKAAAEAERLAPAVPHAAPELHPQRVFGEQAPVAAPVAPPPPAQGRYVLIDGKGNVRAYSDHKHSLRSYKSRRFSDSEKPGAQILDTQEPGFKLPGAEAPAPPVAEPEVPRVATPPRPEPPAPPRPTTPVEMRPPDHPSGAFAPPERPRTPPPGRDPAALKAEADAYVQKKLGMANAEDAEVRCKKAIGNVNAQKQRGQFDAEQAAAFKAALKDERDRILAGPKGSEVGAAGNAPLEHALLNGEVKFGGKIEKGQANSVWTGTVDGHGVVIKEIPPAARDPRGERAAIHERNAYLMAGDLGMPGARVPVTVVREINGQTYVVQQFVTGGRAGTDYIPDAEDLLGAEYEEMGGQYAGIDVRQLVTQDEGQGMAIFDYITNNYDRNIGNFMVRQDAAEGERLVAIDHSLAFGNLPPKDMSTSAFGGDLVLNDAQRQQLIALRDNDALWVKMAESYGGDGPLVQQELDAVKARIGRLLDTGKPPVQVEGEAAIGFDELLPGRAVVHAPAGPAFVEDSAAARRAAEVAERDARIAARRAADDAARERRAAAQQAARDAEVAARHQARMAELDAAAQRAQRAAEARARLEARLREAEREAEAERARQAKLAADEAAAAARIKAAAEARMQAAIDLKNEHLAARGQNFGEPAGVSDWKPGDPPPSGFAWEHEGGQENPDNFMDGKPHFKRAEPAQPEVVLHPPDHPRNPAEGDWGHAEMVARNNVQVGDVVRLGPGGAPQRVVAAREGGWEIADVENPNAVHGWMAWRGDPVERVAAEPPELAAEEAGRDAEEVARIARLADDYVAKKLGMANRNDVAERCKKAIGNVNAQKQRGQYNAIEATALKDALKAERDRILAGPEGGGFAGAEGVNGSEKIMAESPEMSIDARSKVPGDSGNINATSTGVVGGIGVLIKTPGHDGYGMSGAQDYAHERSAFLLAQELDLGPGANVPTVVIRKLTGAKTAVRDPYAHEDRVLMEFVPKADMAKNSMGYGRDNPFTDQISREEAENMAVFDYMLQNSDRHPGNYMIKQDAPFGTQLVPIDHGLTMRSTTTDTAGQSAFAGRITPNTDTRAAAKRVLANDGLWAAMQKSYDDQGISGQGRSELAALRARIENVANGQELRISPRYKDWKLSDLRRNGEEPPVPPPPPRAPAYEDAGSLAEPGEVWRDRNLHQNDRNLAANIKIYKQRIANGRDLAMNRAKLKAAQDEVARRARRARLR